jgi:hypothetical protein
MQFIPLVCTEWEYTFPIQNTNLLSKYISYMFSANVSTHHLADPKEIEINITAAVLVGDVRPYICVKVWHTTCKSAPRKQ